MNIEIFKGNWNEMKGKIKQHWGKLTDNEILEIQGSTQKLEGILQKKYGYRKERLKKEIESFIKHYS